MNQTITFWQAIFSWQTLDAVGVIASILLLSTLITATILVPIMLISR